MPTVAVHEISFRGKAGGIFVLLSISVVLFVIGFATTGWSIVDGRHEGLWLKCDCRDTTNHEDWFKATQAMITIGLICLLLAFILISVYMCIHTISKNAVISALVIVCFVSVLFMVIGFAVYGSKSKGLNWSYAFTVMAGITTLAAGILSFIQMRESYV